MLAIVSVLPQSLAGLLGCSTGAGIGRLSLEQLFALAT
jgi:hypothetical protein